MYTSSSKIDTCVASDPLDTDTQVLAAMRMFTLGLPCIFGLTGNYTFRAWVNWNSGYL